MKSSTAKKVVAIFSIIFGILALIGSFGDDPQTTSIIISIGMIVIGILLLIPNFSEKTQKGLIIAVLAYYSLTILVGFAVMMVAPPVGVLIIGIVLVPFIFSIVYLVRQSKEVEEEKSRQVYLRFQQETKDRLVQNGRELESKPLERELGIEGKLQSLKNLQNSGLITTEDYERKKADLLDQMK